MRPTSPTMKRVVYLAAHAEPHLLEFGVHTIALLWGMWVLLPMWSFTAPPFDAMEVMAPEWLWGLAVMFIGGFGLWALSRERRMLNIAALVLLGAFYGSITAFILLTTPAVSGVPVYGGLALLTLFCAYRA